MSPEIAALLAIAAAVIGVCGIIVPVLPGSITIGAGMLVWGLFSGSPWGWVAFGIGALLLLAGSISSTVLTKRNLDARQIPTWPILVGLVMAIVGNFTLPALGLPIGFAVGLLAAEWVRVKNFRKAVDTSWVAVKSLGMGMLIELVCALTACMVLAISMAIVFFSRR